MAQVVSTAGDAARQSLAKIASDRDWSGFPDQEAASAFRKALAVARVVGSNAAADAVRRIHDTWTASQAVAVGDGDAAERSVRAWLDANPDTLRSIVLEVAKGIITPPPQRIEVVIPQAPAVDVTEEHVTFPKLLSLLALRQHTYLVGPAGTGKTESAQRAADKLGLRWSYWAANPTATAAALLGYQDANGQYVRTPFREAYEHGGVFILDELDNARDDLPTTLNGAMAGQYGAFPDGLVKRHPDFVVVATGNTWGRGADRVYSGRRQLDGATLNRFAKLLWDYDPQLEHRIAPLPEWTEFVQAIREAVLNAGIREVVSMRQSIMGGNLLLSGWSWSDTCDAVIFNGWSQDSIARVRHVIDQVRWEMAQRRIDTLRAELAAADAAKSEPAKRRNRKSA